MKRLILSCLFFAPLVAEHRVLLFFRAYPGIGSAIPVSKVLTMSNYEKASREVVNANLKSFPVAGIWTTYAGYMNDSDGFTGGIIFPRKQKTPVFDIIVAPRIDPVLMDGRVVHHWQLLKNVPARAYKMERLQDQDTGMYYWETTKANLPENGVVPLRSIVIFARPDEVYIPTGATLSNDNAQLVLPDVYITKKVDPAKSTVGVLRIKHFFRLVRPQYKKGSDTSWIWQLID